MSDGFVYNYYIYALPQYLRAERVDRNADHKEMQLI